VTSLYGFSLLGGYQDIRITTGFPLPAANRFACFVLFDRGACRVQVWVELEQEAVLPLAELFGGGAGANTSGANGTDTTGTDTTGTGTTGTDTTGTGTTGPGVIELYTFGRVPLLQTRATVPVTGPVQDSRGGRFIVKREGKITTLYSENVLDIDPGPGPSRYLDLLNASPGETDTTAFNFDRELV
jgi:hypothetical protein